MSQQIDEDWIIIQAYFDNEDPNTVDWSGYEGSDNDGVAQESDVDISKDDIPMNGDKYDDDDDSDNSTGELDFDTDVDDDVDIDDDDDDDVSDNNAPWGGDEGGYDDFMDDASSGSNGDEDNFGEVNIDQFDKRDDDSGSGGEDNDSEDVDVAAAWASDDSEDEHDSDGGDEEGCSTPRQPQPRRAKVLPSGVALVDADDCEMLIAKAMQAQEGKDMKGSSSKVKSNKKQKTSTAASSGNQVSMYKSTSSNKIATKEVNDDCNGNME
jgi:hypothetical protein